VKEMKISLSLKHTKVVALTKHVVFKFNFFVLKIIWRKTIRWHNLVLLILAFVVGPKNQTLKIYYNVRVAIVFGEKRSWSGRYDIRSCGKLKFP